jgi:hypothetical protein
VYEYAQESHKSSSSSYDLVHASCDTLESLDPDQLPIHRVILAEVPAMSLDAAHVHLILNHVPVVGAPLLLLLLTLGLWRGSRELITISLVLIAGLAVVTGLVCLTGESAEELVEHAPWFREALAEAHEERAALSLAAVLTTGGLAGAAFMLRASPRAGRRLTRVTWAGLALSTILLGWTAWSGGQIRHEEVRAEAVGPSASN